MGFGNAENSPMGSEMDPLTDTFFGHEKMIARPQNDQKVVAYLTVIISTL